MVRNKTQIRTKRKRSSHSEVEEELKTRVTMDKLMMIKNIFGELFSDKTERIRKKSPFGNLSTWKLIQIIVKQGCDLRQEQFAIQLISQFDQIFKSYKVPIWLMPYEIICTGSNSGLVQSVNDTISLDSLNKKLKSIGIVNLNEFFRLYFHSKSVISYNYL